MRGGYIAPASLSGEVRATYPRGLQPSDIGPDGTIAWARLRHVQTVRDAERYVIHEGDVLLPLRSTRLNAVVARGVPAGVIALGHWAIISVDPSVGIPEYFSWYLNHPATNQRLRGMTKGSKLQFLPLAALREFEVDLPQLDLQHRISHADALHNRVYELEHRLAQARKRLVDALTMGALLRAAESTTNNA